MSDTYLYAQWSSTGWSEAGLHFETLAEYIEQARKRSADKWGLYAVFEQDNYYDESLSDYEQPLVLCYKGRVYKMEVVSDE